MLGNTPCTIISESASQIVCELQERADATIDTQAFHTGLISEMYDQEDKIADVFSGANSNPTSVSSRLEGSTPLLQGSHFVQRLRGFF